MKKYSLALLLWLPLSLILALWWFINIMGPVRFTWLEYLSVVVGWQWILLLAYTGYTFFKAIQRKSDVHAYFTLVCAIVLVAIVTPAAQVRNSQLFYREYDGGPSGPEFECLLWEHSKLSGEYDDSFLSINFCTIMNIPRYAKYLENGRSWEHQLSDAEVNFNEFRRTIVWILYAEALFLIPVIFNLKYIGRNKVKHK